MPQNDVDQDRQRLRLRARLGADIDLGENFTAGFRVATGSDNSPTSENQTLGGVNSFTQGQGGNFGKYEAWIDRAFLRYEIELAEGEISITGGRFDNPFFHTSMIWSDDLAFDGAAIQGKYKVAEGVTPFFSGGAFPIFNTDLNFSTDNSEKFSSEDKWLFAGQAGVNWAIDKDWSVKVAAAYYDFDNIEGKCRLRSCSLPTMNRATPTTAGRSLPKTATPLHRPAQLSGSRAGHDPGNSVLWAGHAVPRFGPDGTGRLRRLRSVSPLAHRRIHRQYRLQPRRDHQ